MKPVTCLVSVLEAVGFVQGRLAALAAALPLRARDAGSTRPGGRRR